MIHLNNLQAGLITTILQLYVCSLPAVLDGAQLPALASGIQASVVSWSQCCVSKSRGFSLVAFSLVEWRKCIQNEDGLVPGPSVSDCSSQALTSELLSRTCWGIANRG